MAGKPLGSHLGRGTGGGELSLQAASPAIRRLGALFFASLVFGPQFHAGAFIVGGQRDHV